MNKNTTRNQEVAELGHADLTSSEQPESTSVHRSTSEYQQLIRELQARNIELALRNEELFELQAVAEARFARYANLYDFAPVGYFALSKDSAINATNDAGAQLLGQDRAALQGQRLSSFVVESDRTVFSEILRCTFETQSSPTGEISLTTPGQPPRIVTIYTSVVPASLECHVVLVDVTEQRKTEAALGESESRFRAIIDTEPECVKLLTQDGTLLDMNAAGLRMLEADSLQQVKNKCVYPLIVEKHRNAFRELNAKVFRGESGTLEFQIVGLKGNRRWLETHASPLRDREGRITAQLSITRNITEKKRDEEALRQSEGRFRSIVESDLIGLIFWNSDGDITEANNAFLRMVGYTRDELLAGHVRWHDMTPPEYRMLDEQALRDVAATGSCTPYEKEYLRKDGSRLPILIGGASFSEQPGQGVAFVIDNSERKHANAALAAERQLLRTMADNLPAHVFVKDTKGRYLFVNLAHVQQLGLNSEAELLGKTVFDVFPYEIARVIDEDDQTVIRTGQPAIEREEPYVTNGVSGWYLTTKVPLRDAKNNVSGLVGIALDITERKRIQDSLRNSEERYRLLFERNLAGVFQSTLGGQILDCNDAFVRMLGFESKDEMLQCPSVNLYPHHQTRAGFIKLLSAKGKLSGFELQLKRKDGNLIWGIENVTLATMGPDGQKIIQGTIVEVTELKRTEQALRLSEASLASAQDLAKLGSWEVDLQNQTVRWSQYMFRLFECDPAASTPTFAEFLELIHPDDRQQLLESYARLVDSGQVASGDFRFDSKDGMTRHYSHNVQCLRDTQGQAVRLVGTVQDTTEQRRLEEQLRQSQKMEAIGKLTGGVAHDFNNLLTVINGNSEVVLNSLAENHPQRRLLAEVVKAGARAASLTSQLLAFGRKQLLAPRSVSLNDVVRSIETMLLRTIGEHIQLMTSFDFQLNKVRVDPNQFEHVIINLAVNARDAMPKGGCLTIAAANLELNDEDCRKYPGCQPGRFVLLEVTDTGCGMPPEVQSHIFEPFFTTKEMGKGTGLGLAMVHGIVTQSNGHISVDSSLDVGTTFKILLPASLDVVSSHTTAPVTREIRRGEETILLVEDEDGVRKLARLILDMQGYQVLEAANGLNALEIEKNHSGVISLLITDVVMPKMSGRQLVETVRLRRPNIKTLYISGYIDDAAIRLGIEDSSRAFLQKPFSLEALALKVREMLDD